MSNNAIAPLDGLERARTPFEPIRARSNSFDGGIETVSLSLEYARTKLDSAPTVDDTRAVMDLNEKIASFLAAADTKPATSKLEPYGELIRALRKKRWTYVEIAQALREEFSLSVAPSTIHNFQKVRSKRRRSEDAAPSTIPPSAPINVTTPKRPRFNLDA